MASEHAPSPRREREARRRGVVALSPALVAAAGFVAALLTLVATAPAGSAHLLTLARHAFEGRAFLLDSFDRADPATPTNLSKLVGEAWRALAYLILPAALAALAAALVAGVLQTRAAFTVRPFIPGGPGGPGGQGGSARPPGRLVDRDGLARPLVFAGLTVATLLIALARERPIALAESGPALFVAVAHMLGRVALRSGIVLLAAGLADHGLRVLVERRALRPTRAEAKREQREDEGDPSVRAERRRRHHSAG